MAILNEGRMSKCSNAVKNCIRDMAEHFDGQFDIGVSEGERSNQRQAELFAKGRTEPYDSNGQPQAIVTKAPPGKTAHNPQADFDNEVMAADVCPVLAGTWLWNDIPKFDAIADFVRQYPGVRTGADFPGLKDRPHVEDSRFNSHAAQVVAVAGYDFSAFLPGGTAPAAVAESDDSEDDTNTPNDSAAVRPWPEYYGKLFA